MSKRKKVIIILSILMIAVSYFITIKVTQPAKVEDNQKLLPNTEFIYYINVFYDGKDEFGTESSATTVSNIGSDYIYVEDKIPEGLKFTGFVTTSDGTIGAISQDEAKVCLGQVVDGVNGLNYDSSTNIVSFKVKNLQAGCKLTVGIKTMTPSVDDPTTTVVETRRDFYNYATAKENNTATKSNIVHAWIGNASTTKYNVVYKYTGTVADNIYNPPENTSYAANTIVNVAPNPSIDNYTFSGWQTTDVTVSNGSFTMPSKTVTFTGSFTENPKYTVNYNISGTTPPEYTTPSVKEYYENNIVKLDPLKEGDIVGNYRFLGWAYEGITLEEDRTFTMPNHNVIFTGSFEEIRYNVCYEFINSSLSPPECRSYQAGETVNLVNMDDYLASNNITTLNKFQGWNKETTFIMPQEDVLVTGSWVTVNGYFKPIIEFIDSNPSSKRYHDIGDIEDIGIKVTNNESFPIKDVIIKLNNAIIDDNGYEICTTTCSDTSNYTITNNTIKIYELPPNSIFRSKTENIVITFSKETLGTTINPEVYIVSAISDNNYLYENDENNKDTKIYNMKSKLKICSQDLANTNNQVFNYHISSSNIDELDSNYYETWISLYSSECKTIYLPIGTYKVEQITPQEFTLNSVNGTISNNGDSFTCELNQNYHIDFINQYTKKSYFHSYGRVINNVLSMMGVV